MKGRFDVALVVGSVESHVLHIVFLDAPDFLGCESAFAMARSRPELAETVRQSLKLKKAGNAIVDTLGGRAIHPVNVRVGGFYRPRGRRSSPRSPAS
jgi:sulfhydrogenase subunit alpha